LLPSDAKSIPRLDRADTTSKSDICKLQIYKEKIL
jgi:hypothetical protein